MYHKATAGQPGNNKVRFRIDFEQLEKPGVGMIGDGESGYIVTGGQSTTRLTGVKELGWWGGRHDFGSDTVKPNPFYVNDILTPLAPQTYTIPYNIGGGGDDGGGVDPFSPLSAVKIPMKIPMPPGYIDVIGTCGDGPYDYIDINGNTHVGATGTVSYTHLTLPTRG